MSQSSTTYPQYYFWQSSELDTITETLRAGKRLSDVEGLENVVKGVLELMGLTYTAVKIVSQEEPYAIFVRSKVHNTTINQGERGTDPKGYHLTFNYKLKLHVDQRKHITGHVYVDNPRRLNVRETKFTPLKDDVAPKATVSKKPVTKVTKDGNTDQVKARTAVKKSKPSKTENPAWPDEKLLWRVPHELVSRMHLAL
ncbi:hypothetical protein E4U22_006911 [Claviceps purpurea]|nr:hypothetical protein E4U22_006911 [Claviceps purpurea]